MPEADEALVRRSQAGDRGAFEELVRRCGRLVFARLYLETGDAHRAEDLAQETFLLAWRSIRQVTEAAGFRAWLTRIAHTVVVDSVRHEHRKKRRGRGTREGEEAMGLLTAREPGPAAAAERDDERQRVLSVLRSLPAEYREPLMLRYIAGADYETIGRQLAISNGSLRGLLGRGLTMLREEMKEKPEGRMTKLE